MLELSWESETHNVNSATLYFGLGYRTKKENPQKIRNGCPYTHCDRIMKMILMWNAATWELILRGPILTKFEECAKRGIL